MGVREQAEAAKQSVEQKTKGWEIHYWFTVKNKSIIAPPGLRNES